MSLNHSKNDAKKDIIEQATDQAEANNDLQDEDDQRLRPTTTTTTGEKDPIDELTEKTGMNPVERLQD